MPLPAAHVTLSSGWTHVTWKIGRLHTHSSIHHQSPSQLQHCAVNHCCSCRMETSMETSKLPRRALGKTGLEISVLGFGASPLGSVFEAIDEDEGVRAVHEAYKLGINFFDTSPFYGDTKSETVLGRALKDLPRDEIVVATKVGRFGAEDFDFSRDRVLESLQSSLRRLQVSYVDLIQCHDIEFADLDQVVHEALPALLSAKQQGLVRHIGITGLPLDTLRKVLDRVEAGTVEVVLSYCHCTLNDSSLMTYLPYFERKGVAVINASPLAMGLLTAQGPPEWHPAPDSLKEASRAAAAAAKEQGVDIARLAIMYSLKQPGIVTHLVGCTTVSQVRDNFRTAVEALGAADCTDGARLSAVQLAVMPIFDSVRDMTWPSGRPENC